MKTALKRHFEIISLFIILVACNNNSIPNGFYVSKTNPEIRNTYQIQKLNDSLEYSFNYSENNSPIKGKRSADISIRITENNTVRELNKLKAYSTFDKTYYADKNNELQANKNDTIIVYIDNFDGYSSEGVKIKIFKNFYKITHLVRNDVLFEKEPTEKTIINSTYLELDKKEYVKSDSIFGKIQCEYNYIRNNSLKKTVKVSGYFRVKIKENLN